LKKGLKSLMQLKLSRISFYLKCQFLFSTKGNESNFNLSLSKKFFHKKKEKIFFKFFSHNFFFLKKMGNFFSIWKSKDLTTWMIWTKIFRNSLILKKIGFFYKNKEVPSSQEIIFMEKKFQILKQKKKTHIIFQLFWIVSIFESAKCSFSNKKISSFVTPN